ncbi:MAG TPA: MarR family transcriptional regulator [Thermoleophilaceae bacterium]|jgi:DNA-binding MarR family transcriptional regulator|nr:MarR family transcriptional regulator [Actinomycetota bacterium]HYN49424.1 MarR family transcriptional regulator [Thermoleophilaceae bacterium]
MAEVREAFRLNGQAGDTMDQAAADFLGLHRTDTRLLDVLQMSGGMSAGELARAGHLSPAAVTAALDRLEKAGYVHRFRDEVDRRRVLVEVTDRMQKLTGELYGPLAKSGAEMMSGFSEQQLQAVRDLLREATQLQLEQAERVLRKKKR